MTANIIALPLLAILAGLAAGQFKPGDVLRAQGFVFEIREGGRVTVHFPSGKSENWVMS